MKLIDQLQEGMKIRFKVKDGDWMTYAHFSPSRVYELYTLQSAYPNMKLDNPNELIIWCEEEEIHYVSLLNPEEWEIVLS